MIQLSRYSLFALALCLCIFMNGCAIGPKTEETTFYTLSPELEPAEQDLKRTAMSIEIGDIGVSEALKGQKIYVLRNQNIMDFYAGAKWASNLSHMTRDFMAQALEQAFGPVVSSSRGSDQSCLEISFYIRDFQAQYADSTDSAPNIHVTILATISSKSVEKKSHRLILNKSLTADENKLSAVVLAFEKAMSQIALELTHKIGQFQACQNRSL